MPFIARYRKEATGGLNDTQLHLAGRAARYLRELYERRAAVLESLGEQDKLTRELRARRGRAHPRLRGRSARPAARRPAGLRATIGLDPGLRTDVNIAVVDAIGKLLDTATIFPHEPRRGWEGALYTLAALARKHAVELIAIDNGTAATGDRQTRGRVDQAATPNSDSPGSWCPRPDRFWTSITLQTLAGREPRRADAAPLSRAPLGHHASSEWLQMI